MDQEHEVPGASGRASRAHPFRAGWFAAHELNTALQALKGGLEVLMAGRENGYSALQAEALGLMACAAGELEAHVARLGAIALLAQEAKTPVATIGLAELFQAPEIVAVARLGPSIADAHGGLVISTRPPLVAEAIRSLALIDSGRRTIMSFEIAAITPRHVSLICEIGCADSGENAILYRLAGAQFEAAAVDLRADGLGASLVTFACAASCTRP